MLLLMMESFAKERLVVSEKTTDSITHESASAKGKEEASTSKSADTNRNAEECRVERKADNDDLSTDRSKFKKVEMPVFTREDPDSWLFRAERYFQIHQVLKKKFPQQYPVAFVGYVRYQRGRLLCASNALKQ